MEPLKTIAIALTGAVLAALPASAQEVGTATAVNPLSQSTAPGGETGPLRVGARIVHKERIQTSAQGTTQLLFLDKSSMSIGPNANIVIDDYVYNPNEHSGHMAASLTRGALRFVGGELSHAGETTITTPVAVIGIRGGTANISVDANGVRVINLNGNLKVFYQGGVQSIWKNGWALTITNAGTLIGPEKVLAPEINHNLVLLTSKHKQDGGVSGLHQGPVTDYGVGGLQGYVDPYAFFPTNTGQSDANQLIIQGTQNGSGRGTPPHHGGS